MRIPNRRYSPRPAQAADLVTRRYSENSKTDSKVWMREEVYDIQCVSNLEFFKFGVFFMSIVNDREDFLSLHSK